MLAVVHLDMSLSYNGLNGRTLRLITTIRNARPV
jgi:hypothetical protein